MRYSWEVYEPNHLVPGHHMPLTPPWRDIEDADTAEEIAKRICPQLLPGHRLNIWDTEGVGKMPVLTVDV